MRMRKRKRKRKRNVPKVEDEERDEDAVDNQKNVRCGVDKLEVKVCQVNHDWT